MQTRPPVPRLSQWMYSRPVPNTNYTYILNLLRKRVFFFKFAFAIVTFLLQVKGTLYPSDTPVKTELILSYIRVCFIFFQTRWKTRENNKPLFHPGQLENYVILKWHHSATTPSQRLLWEIRVRQWQHGREHHSSMNPAPYVSKWLFHCHDILKMKLQQLCHLRQLITQHPLSLKLTTLAQTRQPREWRESNFK